MLWVWVGGGVLAMMLLCCGGVGVAYMKIKGALVEASTPEVSLGDPSQLFPLADVRLPEFPELGDPTATLDPSGVQVHWVDFQTVPANGVDPQPGTQMQLRVYLPKGEYAAHSLPCVLVAPAGSNLISGAQLDNDDYHDETLPYAEEGMAVVFYSLDGSMEGDDSDPEEMAPFYHEFREARAGVVNGRNALDFVLARLPQVDPQRIYSAGHSSAGTLSLLLAEHEPRLRGCIAYAPATDVEARLGEAGENALMGLLFPGLGDFIRQSSPKTHVAQLNCPVFLFHARDDSNEPFATTQEFSELLKSNGKSCEFSIAESGDHYDSMIDQGIPRGIEWLKSQAPSGQ